MTFFGRIRLTPSRMTTNADLWDDEKRSNTLLRHRDDDDDDLYYSLQGERSTMRQWTAASALEWPRALVHAMHEHVRSGLPYDLIGGGGERNRFERRLRTLSDGLGKSCTKLDAYLGARAIQRSPNVRFHASTLDVVQEYVNNAASTSQHFRHTLTSTVRGATVAQVQLKTDYWGGNYYIQGMLACPFYQAAMVHDVMQNPAEMLVWDAISFARVNNRMLLVSPHPNNPAWEDKLRKVAKTSGDVLQIESETPLSSSASSRYPSRRASAETMGS